MRFLQNLFSYWANLILVETLANSRTFQRFAISTDKVLKELKKKGKPAALRFASSPARALSLTPPCAAAVLHFVQASFLRGT